MCLQLHRQRSDIRSGIWLDSAEMEAVVPHKGQSEQRGNWIYERSSAVFLPDCRIGLQG